MLNLKSWPHFFESIISGEKTHDLRDARDKHFYAGQILNLQEYDPFGKGYTGREQRVEVTFITDRETPCALSSAVLQPGYAILSIRKIT
jgi:uncharacterized protein YqfB (UPF0267 family)